MTNLNLFDRPAPAPPTKALSWWDELPEEHGPDVDGLRWYQRSGYDAVLRAYAAGNRCVLTVMATGLGKTQLFCAIAKHWKGPVLIVAHRDELIEQARQRLELMTGRWVETEQAELSSSANAQLVVGSVASFNKRRLERLGKDRFTLVIIDEAHHATAPSYKRIINFFGAANVLGVTATPDRGDERALGQVFDEVAYTFDIEDGIDNGFLVPIRGREVVLQEIELDNVGTTAGDLTASQLDEEMVKAVEGIVRKTRELEPDRQGIAFFPGVKTAEYAAQKFNEVLPGSAAFVSGTSPYEERKAIVKDFKAGRLQYLCNCMVATEGFDAPSASLIIQGRPTKSRSLYAQITGRGTRILPGVIDSLPLQEQAEARRMLIASSAKPDCMILDFVGNSTKHTLVSPADVLGGNYSEEEVALAKRKAKESSGDDPREALKAARAELQRLAKAVKAKRVTASVRNFDPFAVMNIDVAEEDRLSTRFGQQPASAGQVEALKKLGIDERDLQDVSKRAATKLFTEARRRSELGLATFKQLRQLQKYGVTDVNVTKARAGEAMNYISQKGWGRLGRIDPIVLNEIVSHRREAGED